MTVLEAAERAWWVPDRYGKRFRPVRYHGPRTTTFDAGRLCTTLADVYAEVDRLNGPARRIDWNTLTAQEQ
jgi:hypothetical protein